ncbi:DUF6069 family protein [Actinomadura terrae]|uniref:DUF6069 family protein n=1 Tax=Actinomadura terrae TaxID=604353 RepID=UPI001FA799EB|nr:DUF6069 family protein [Actinomadura terrae]
MHAATAASVRDLTSRPLWLVGAVAGAAASAATEVYGLVARAAGVPMEAGGIGAATADPVTVGMFAMGTVICTTLGTVLALVLARYASRPARIFVTVAVALTAVSLFSPLAAGDTAVSTKIMLCLSHVLAAAIVIPAIARRLARP